MTTYTIAVKDSERDLFWPLPGMGPYADAAQVAQVILHHYAVMDNWFVCEMADGAEATVIKRTPAVQWLDEQIPSDLVVGNDVRLFGTNAFQGVAAVGGVILDYTTKDAGA